MGVQSTLTQSSPGAIDENELAKTAIEFAEQSEKLSLLPPEEGNHDAIAVEAQFVTPHDTVIVTADGHRLPTVPVQEAHKLNVLREELETQLEPTHHHTVQSPNEEKAIALSQQNGSPSSSKKSTDASLKRSMPPSHTNPLFPPLPLYGPPSFLTHVQCLIFRVTSFFLSLAFLAVIVLGALFTSIGPSIRHLWQLATFGNPDASRPFYSEELRREKLRKEQEEAWTSSGHRPTREKTPYPPTEGGPDPLVCDPAYYARRVGLDIEAFEVQTEDGFLIDLWHVYDPNEQQRTPLPASERAHRGPETFTPPRKPLSAACGDKPVKFPVLLMHGLLQSSGAYCVNDEDSLAFLLAKAGYDVWLGNNRCGFAPRHTLLECADPRMWAWNIRQMGVFDLPALVSRVCYETGFGRVGLVCHSQGTTQALVALAKEQRPELGERITVFCGLAPAAYAGPLIGKMYFKFMRVISPGFFRVMFGIHAFIPFMMEMHKRLDGRVYGWLGYKVFGFLFNWSDKRWDRGLRDRMFRFAPVYVSSESMRWWLGRECFAKHKCILSTKEEWRAEEREDGEDDRVLEEVDRDMDGGEKKKRGKKKGSTAWYNEKVPPFALWVAGSDDLVDGHKLLRRFERGREPHVEVVHQKVIPEYEHLDVIWAMDAPEQVFKEVKEVLWKTCDVRDICQVPKGCEDVPAWEPRKKKEETDAQEEELQSSSSEDLSP
ncbi:Alpha/Beta hydrolase protein [Cercophora samala]|uniref:Alpha/Beta hydrolase protein n=1 Tax=Cercophora samala TaxID=330535 RepID=A0AA39ZFZ5_9PEZI|nr:Alpha/Beta hydrolase protein [Cercophora samala]